MFIPVPPSGGGGGGDRVIFITSTQSNGNLGGIAGADATCQARGNAGTITGPLGRTWKAIISTSGNNVNSRISFDGIATLKNTNGEVVLANATWGGMSGLSNPPHYDENAAVRDAYAWTGSNSSGNYAAGMGDCSSWADGSGGSTGGWGWSNTTNSSWADLGYNTACNSGAGYALYCISSP